MTELAQQFNAFITDQLSSAQMNRLRQIVRQERLPFTFKTSEVVAALGLTRQQREDINRIIQQTRPNRGDGREGPGLGGPPRFGGPGGAGMDGAGNLGAVQTARDLTGRRETGHRGMGRGLTGHREMVSVLAILGNCVLTGLDRRSPRTRCSRSSKS